ncbi:MAG: membrane protein insertase YidC [Nitrospirae bacterium]|nr:membrane protein insertase YidC [Nitrospirota bacterium]
MEKRVVLFLILSVAIIIGYDYLLKEFGLAPQPVQPERPNQTVAPSAPAPSSEPAQGSGPIAPDLGAPDARRPPADSRIQGEAQRRPASEEKTEEVVTELFRAVFTNRGAEIRSWALRRYTAATPTGPQPIQLMHTEGKFRGPLSVQTADPAINKQLAEGLYHAERDFSTLDAAHPTGHLTFTYEIPQTGVRVIKQLTFHYRSYLVDVAVRTEGVTSALDVGLGTNFGIVEWGEGFIGLIGPASMVDDKIEKDTPETELERKGSVRWVAMQDKYFLSVLLPANATAALVKKEGDKLVSAGLRFAPPAPTAEVSMRLYAGPKEFDTLKALNVGLEDTIDFGWFIYGSWDIVKAVAKPLFYVLRFLYDFTHNYGVAIVLLTVGIKLLFVPLQYKSYKSMKDMQVIQPKVAALQAKYKDDRERLNRELIKLYRDHKVNPVGGCLPMLLQMPVFVALFNILYMTIDLRQAPFVLWITDLSVQDPYYVLPVIMGVSMVVQQKIMPTTMDPTQAKIMLMLPAFMTLLFLTFPAGLVLYWLTNNVLTIAQQFITDRYIFKKPTFSSSSEPSPDAVTPDGEKPTGKRKKEKAVEKAEADSQVET